MEEADFVAVFLGGDVPFVVQEVAGSEEGSLEERMRENKPVPMHRKFQLNGECYFDRLIQVQVVVGVEIARDVTLI
jgi:hypothetical protein